MTNELKPVAFMYVREGLQPVVSISPLVRPPKNATVVELIPAIPPTHRVVSVAELNKLKELIWEYYELGAVEGAEGRNHDTKEGAAANKWQEICAIIDNKVE